MYYLMDGRANYDIDAAIVLDCCNTLKEAVENINRYGADTCIVKDLGSGQTLVWSLMWGQPNYDTLRKPEGEKNETRR